MTKIKELNIIPISNNMIITAYLENRKGNIILMDKPKFLSAQQVLAIGPRVEDIKVGDWVYVDFQRFVKHVKTKSKIKAGLGGQDMIQEEFIPPAFVAPGDDGAYLKLTDREIEGVIKDYSTLPKIMTNKITVEDYEIKLFKQQKEAEAKKVEFDKEKAEKASRKRQEKGYTKAPAIVAEGKFRG